MENAKFIPPLFEQDGQAILTGLKKGEYLARYAIIAVRDPLGFSKDAADVIADSMENVREITRNSFFTVLLGEYKDTNIIVCSTGSGAADTEVVMMDLMQYAGVDTFLRVGTSGTQREDIEVGDIIISSGAVRDEGLTKEYIAPQFPAIASYELMLPMIEIAQKNRFRHRVGLTRSNDAIYCGQGRPVMGYLPYTQENVVKYWVDAGVLNVEREASTILTLAELFHARGGSVCVICNSSVTKKVGVSQGIDEAIFVSLEGLALLAKRDKEKEEAGVEYWTPWITEK